MSTKKQQVADQTLKGAIVGVVAYVLARYDIDPNAQAVVMPVLIAGLAYASTLVGNKGTASFLDKAIQELPKVVEVVENTVTPAKKEVAQKVPAKKAAAKKTAPKA